MMDNCPLGEYCRCVHEEECLMNEEDEWPYQVVLSQSKES